MDGISEGIDKSTFVKKSLEELTKIREIITFLAEHKPILYGLMDQVRDFVDQQLSEILELPGIEDRESAAKKLEDRLKNCLTNLDINIFPTEIDSKPIKSRLLRHEYDKRREEIRDVMYAYAEANPHLAGAKITYNDLSQILEEEGIPISSGYIIKIVNEPKSLWKYHQKTRTYSFVVITRNVVEELADSAINNVGMVSQVDIQLQLGIKGHGKEVGAFLPKWAKAWSKKNPGKELKSKMVSRGKLYGVVKTYYDPEINPPLSQFETIKAFAGDRAEIPLIELVEKTGIPLSIIYPSMPKLHYKLQDGKYIKK